MALVLTQQLNLTKKKLEHSEICHVLVFIQRKIYLLLEMQELFVLKIKKCGQEKFVNRSILINPNGRIIARYDKIHMFDVKISNKETHKESKSFL